MKDPLRYLAVVALCLNLSACDNESDDPLVYQNEAIESYVLGHFQESLLSLKMGLKLDPSNKEMRKLLGEVWLKLGDPKACIEQLEKAAELGMHNNDLVLSLGECLQYQGDHARVLTLNFTGDLHAVSNQDIAELLALKSMSSLALNDSDVSLDYLDKAMNLSPEMPEVVLAKVHWLAANHEVDQAFLVLENFKNENPKHAKAWALLGDLYRSHYELDEAEAAYTQAIIHTRNQLDMLNYFLYRALVRTYKQSYSGALEDLHKVEVLIEDHPKTLYVRGMIELAQKQYTQAIQSFQNVVSKSENFVYAHYFLGLSYTLTKNLHSAREHLVKFSQYQPKHVYGQKLLALVEIQLGELDQAIDRLQWLTEAHPSDADSVHLLGEAYLKHGEIRKGAHYLEKALALDPERLEAQFKLGVANVELGDTTSARWAFGQVLERYPQYRKAILMKFMNEFKASHYELALNLANSYTKYFPKEPLGYNLTAMVKSAQGNHEGALAIYQQVLTMDKHDVNANTMLAKASIKEGKYETAKTYLETIIEKKPHVPTMLRLASFHIKQGDIAKAIALLQDAVEIKPNDLPAHMALTKLYLEQGEHDKAIGQLMQVPKEMRSRQAYAALQGYAYMAQKDYLQADKVYQLLSKQPSLDLLCLEFMSEYAYYKKDYQAYGKWVDQLLQFKENGRWIRWKANALWLQQEHQLALHVLKDWVTRNPSDHKTQMWYANYLMRNDNYTEAKSVYKHLLKYQPNNPIIYNNLAWILRDSSPNEAKFYIEKALKLQPDWKSALDTKQKIDSALSDSNPS